MKFSKFYEKRKEPDLCQAPIEGVLREMSDPEGERHLLSLVRRALTEIAGDLAIEASEPSVVAMEEDCGHRGLEVWLF